MVAISDIVEASSWIALQGSLKIIEKAKDSVAIEAARESLRTRQWENDFGHVGPQDKVWRILLELFLASENGGGLTVKSLWVSSGLPETTALRTLKMMEREGHLLRVRNPEDFRSFIIVLSEDLKQRIARYLEVGVSA